MLDTEQRDAALNFNSGRVQPIVADSKMKQPPAHNGLTGGWHCSQNNAMLAVINLKEYGVKPVGKLKN
jgi:hypothetical protein